MSDLQKSSADNNLLVSFEAFKDELTLWLNQGDCQIKINLGLEEGLAFAEWLLQTDEEDYPYIGLPLPGSQQVDYFKPENKILAVEAFGFKGENLRAFKFFDLEYGSKSLEISFGLIEFTFLSQGLSSFQEGAKKVVKYISYDD